MRISDWSSDVCSSDLVRGSDPHGALQGRREHPRVHADDVLPDDRVGALPALSGDLDARTVRGGERAQRGTRTVAGEEVDVLVERDSLGERSEEHTSELQSLMRISYAVFCLKKKKQPTP